MQVSAIIISTILIVVGLIAALAAHSEFKERNWRSGVEYVILSAVYLTSSTLIQ